MGNYLIDMEERPCYCEKNRIWVAEGEPNIQWFCSPTCAAERIETINNPAVPGDSRIEVTNADKL